MCNLHTFYWSSSALNRPIRIQDAGHARVFVKIRENVMLLVAVSVLLCVIVMFDCQFVANNNCVNNSVPIQLCCVS
jgi:hypothetical protein